MSTNMIPIDPKAVQALKQKMNLLNAGGAGPGGGSAADAMRKLDDLIRQHINAEPWSYYDTKVISSFIPKGETAATNFADLTESITFFAGHTAAKHGGAVTNMTSINGQFDQDFLCLAIAVDVNCPADAPSTGGICTAQAFVETLLHWGVLSISFSDVPKLQRKLIEFPSGGGVYVDSKIRTQGAPGFSDSANANNGNPTPQALRILEEPIMFQQSSSFTTAVNIYAASSTTGALHRLQGLPALTGDTAASITVRKIGVRGKDLLRGTPRP